MKTSENIPKNPHFEHPFWSLVVNVVGALAIAAGLLLLLVSERAGGSLATGGVWILVLGALSTVVSLLKSACWELRKIHSLLQKQTDQLCGEPEKQDL